LGQLSPAERTQVLSGNATDLYGLDEEAPCAPTA